MLRVLRVLRILRVLTMVRVAPWANGARLRVFLGRPRLALASVPGAVTLAQSRPSPEWYATWYTLTATLELWGKRIEYAIAAIYI